MFTDPGCRFVIPQLANEGSVAALPDGSVGVFYTNPLKPVGGVNMIRSDDGGLTWSEPEALFQTPGLTHHTCLMLVDAQGQLHCFHLHRPGDDFEVWHNRTSGPERAWGRSTPLFQDGYVDSIRGGCGWTAAGCS